MAESKRISGRQGTAATSTSGRLSSSTSGRIAAPSASGRVPAAGSGTVPAAGSGKIPAPGSARVPAIAPASIAPPARASARVPAAGVNRKTASSKRLAPRAGAGPAGANAAGTGPKKKKQRGGPELIIIGAILGVAILGTLVFAMYQNSRVKARDQGLEAEKKIYEDNIKLGKDAYQIAEESGKLFILGKESGVPEHNNDPLPANLKEKLFGQLGKDSQVYNVIYNRDYKDKHNKPLTDQRVLYMDKLRIDKMAVGEVDNEVDIRYGFAENKTIPVVLATKNIKGDETDAANAGGQITVIVRAKNDAKFENVLHPKAPPPEKADKPADSPVAPPQPK